MIECSGAGYYLFICLLTPLRQGLSHTGGIGMPKFMPTGTHGVRHTQMAKKSDAHETLSLLFTQEGSQVLR